MSFPKRTNWSRYRPSDLRGAFRGCKDYARERRNLSVERIAELMGVSPECLYKWLADARMPAVSIPAYEHICGAHFVSEYLAGGAGRIVVKIPAGVPASVEDVARLQAIVAEAVARLARCYRDAEDTENTRTALTESIQAMAWHRENVARLDEPELDLGGDDER